MSGHHASLSPRRCARRASLLLPLVVLLATSCAKPLATALDPHSVLGLAASQGGRGVGSPSRTLGQTIGNIDHQLVVTLAPGADAAQVAQSYGAALVDVEQGFALLQRPADQLLDVPVGLKSDPRVLSSEDNALALPAEARQKSWAFDDGFGSMAACVQQGAALRLGLAQAQTVGRGAGVLVAVLDTGIDSSHPIFAGHLAPGWDFVDNDADPADSRDFVDEDGDGVVDGAYGHGTHVAGIVMLTAPQARILPVRVLDDEGRGDVMTVAAGIRWAVGQGARVINLSLGMTTTSSAVELALLEAQMRGAVVVTSAGNSGAEFPQEYPATSTRVIAVAASDPANHPATFTSFGSFVDLTAPGVAIRSAYPGGLYRLWSGTSMSAPFVSGTAALLLGLHPQWSIVTVMNRLRQTTRPLTGGSFQQISGLGSGVLDVNDALADDRPAGDFGDRRLAAGSAGETP